MKKKSTEVEEFEEGIEEQTGSEEEQNKADQSNEMKGDDQEGESKEDDQEPEPEHDNKANIEADQVQISCFKCMENMTFETDHRPQKHTCICGTKYRVVYRKNQLSVLVLK